MPFLRQLYKQKPSAWGPASSVQASIFKNAEKIGINPASIALAMPMWGPGNQLDYVKGVIGTNLNGCRYDGQGVQFVEYPTPDAGGAQKKIDTGRSTHIWPVTVISNFLVRWDSGNDRYCSIAARGGVFTNNSNFIVGFRVGTNRFFGYYYNGSSLYGAEDTVNAAHNLISPNINKSAAWVLSKGSQYYYVNNTKYQLDTDNFDPGTYTGNICVGGPTAYISTATSFPGRINVIYIFQGIVPGDKILYLSDNHYFLLQRVPPVFYSVPGGAVLPTFNPLFLNAAQPTRVIQ